MQSGRAGGGEVTAYAEVSNTLKVPYVTGIQRTARKLVEHWPEGHPVRLVPVVTGRRRFRTLLDGERAALRTEPSGAEPVSITRGGWRAVARKVPGARGVRDGLVAARGAVDEVRRRPLGIDPGPGDVLLDLEATWWSSADRAQLLPELRARGVRVATLVYDLMLLRNPEWFDPQNRAAFEPWARAQLRHAELALCTSEFVAREIAEFGAPDPPATAVVPLGSDPVDVEPRRPSWLPDDGREFVVCVGTIEPRKNVGSLLAGFERLWAGGGPAAEVRLVLVGREGWDVADLAGHLRDHPEQGDRFVWTGWATDAEVDWLYRHARAAAVPSRCEGYGLPVVEALRRGAPVVSSAGGALAEVGAGEARFVGDETDPAAWARALAEELTGERRRVAPPHLVGWADAARAVADEVLALTRS